MCHSAAWFDLGKLFSLLWGCRADSFWTANLHVKAYSKSSKVPSDQDPFLCIPVMQVELHLVATGVIFTPSAGELKAGLDRAASQIVEASKALVRWMDGTCLECPPLQTHTAGDEPFLLT